MSDLDPLRALRRELDGTRCFEDAAAVAVRAMLSVARGALDAGAYAPSGQVLRGMVHLRPGQGGYRRLWVAELAAGSPALREAEAERSYLPSATAFRWIVEHRSAAAIDVHAGLLLPRGGGAPPGAEAAPPHVTLGSQETLDRLLHRDATHVFLAPLCAPGGAVDGLISIEARCQAAMGRPFIWPACADLLELLADAAAPHLAALPLRRAPAPEPEPLLPVVGATMAPIVGILRVFAQQEETLLLAGPTGVGKSRLARYCHERSRRRGQAFEILDLLAMPEELQLGELFGWRRGAFTGAIKDSPGALARAEGGTLFIDEIDKLSLKAQASLLRLLEERTYRPIGDAAGVRRADVRFLVGTNVDLHEAVRAGRFREDLYYRIHVLPVRIPPLSERLDEVPRWAEYMLARRHEEARSGREGGGAGRARLSGDAERRLVATPLPGNLRQLDNILRRAYALALVDQGATPRDLEIGRAHLERALAYEHAAEPAPLLAELKRAASAFVLEAERRRGGGAPLSLERAEAFTGLVLAAAAGRCGGAEAAFALLGREDLLRNRNHHRLLRREVERVEALLSALGEDADGQLSSLREARRPRPGT